VVTLNPSEAEASRIVDCIHDLVSEIIHQAVSDIAEEHRGEDWSELKTEFCMHMEHSKHMLRDALMGKEEYVFEPKTHIHIIPPPLDGPFRR
tara:strand:+ start:1151 stop:1426 length:276 start_codon:yes stop_codon:yes gene_type:complete